MPIATTYSARSLYERRDGQRVSVLDIQQAKRQGERFVMLTAYDALVAGVFDRVGVPLLVVGDLPFGADHESPRLHWQPACATCSPGPACVVCGRACA